MKDRIKSLVDKNATFDVNLNRIREYLQEYLLFCLYKHKFYSRLVFCGGTALRFIYKIRRFSEDLDFSLSKEAKECDFPGLLKAVKDEFQAAGYDLEMKYSTKTNVYSALFKFNGLLFEYGVSSHKDEKLAIKLEIDVNPPAGGIEQSDLCQDNFLFYMVYFDLASLFAGKTHALLSRKFTKGRDWYDLLWYLTKHKGLEPNFEMLNNALAQSGSIKEPLNSRNWRGYMKKVVDKLDIAVVNQDVFRFLDDPAEIELLTKDNFIKALE